MGTVSMLIGNVSTSVVTPVLEYLFIYLYAITVLPVFVSLV